MTSQQKTLIDHLVELRMRILRSLIVCGVLSAVALIFAKEIYEILQAPMVKALPPNSNFIATTPFESYVTYFKIALFAGFLFSTPYLFYQLWQFITPALTKKEKGIILPASILSGFLFTGGALFGYFVVFPTGFYYVNLILDDTSIQLMPKMIDYLNIATTLLLSFGITFELPLFIFLLGKLGLITYFHIKKFRRYIIVLLFILAAVLTPGPDVLLQLMMALPLWILFELGGLSLKLIEKKENLKME
jgi:sec-independent protein translocase protein TatC